MPNLGGVPSLGGVPNLGGRGIGPRPGPGPGPNPPPSPSTPFGPGDTATPDAAALAARAASLRAALEKVRSQLTGMRDGPGPDNTPPVVKDVSRAEGLWPYLVIRHEPGDTGTRPLMSRIIYDIGTQPTFGSPDIIVTPSMPGAPDEVGRDGIDALLASAVGMTGTLSIRKGPYPIDIWVHVWNLGRAAATGVRIRVYLFPDGFLAGRQVSLAERGRAGSHRVVKVASYTANERSYGYRLVTAVAECITDTANGDKSPGKDRHCGHRVLEFAP